MEKSISLSITINESIKPYLAEYQVIKDTVDSITVTNTDELKRAGDYRARINTLNTGMEEKRKEIKQPFLDAGKQIDAELKPIITAFESVQKLLDAKIIPFMQAEEKRKREYAEKMRQKELAEMERKKKEAEELAYKDGNELALEIATNIEIAQKEVESQTITVKKSVSSEESKTTLKGTWVAVIIDPASVPREYCVPDEKALNAIAKKHKGDFKISGVKFEEKFGLASSKI